MDLNSIKKKLQKALQQYERDKNSVKDYFVSMKEISAWLKEQEK